MLNLKRRNTIGQEELHAATEVIKTGILSDFIGAPGDNFYGGIQVKALEKEWASYFGVKYAISVNSWTSGLITSIGALQLEPGDEVITSPWTMCATATAILQWNLIPIFADIDETTFNINVDTILPHINNKTRAVLAVDIFGKSCDYKEIKKLCKKYNLHFITDSAQAPGLKTKNGFVGTKSDIGGYSLNYHKHIHTGEGGIIVTNDKDLARNCWLIRNHAEACMNNKSSKKVLNNMIGFNFRMGEIEASIARVQLKKLNNNVRERQEIAKNLIEGLLRINHITLPNVDDIEDNAFYIFPIILKGEALSVGRNKLCEELVENGIPAIAGYQNIHKLPIFIYILYSENSI